MEASETNDEAYGRYGVNRQNERHWIAFEHAAEGLCAGDVRVGGLLLVGECFHVMHTDGEHIQHQGGGGVQEHREGSVVVLRHTIADPRTVVVKHLDTVVTDSAVDAARWPIDVASALFTELGTPCRCVLHFTVPQYFIV